MYLEFHYRFKCQLFMEDRSTFYLYPNVLFTPVIWILQIVFIPIWIVMCLSMTGVIYAIILAILLSRSPEIIREQHRGNLTTAVGYSLLVIPMLVFEVSVMVAWLVVRLDKPLIGATYYLYLILKRSRNFLLSQWRKQTVYYLSVNIWVRAYYFYSPLNQITYCQYKLSKKLVQCIIEAQSVLPS